MQFADAAVAAGAAPDGAGDVYSLEMLRRNGRVVIEVIAVFAQVRIRCFPPEHSSGSGKLLCSGCRYSRRIKINFVFPLLCSL